jgi:hypothetical protein
MQWMNTNIVFCFQFLLISFGTLLVVGACAAVPDQREWIKIGHTTKEEVVERYGQPDLVRVSEEGEIAIYRPRDTIRPVPRVEVPTMQAGPLGTTTTKMEPIDPGLSTRPPNGAQYERPRQELRIRYSAQGIVQELIR